LDSKKLSTFSYKTAIWVNFQYLEGIAGMTSTDLAADFFHLAIF
jgi:hypothetical protein